MSRRFATLRINIGGPGKYRLVGTVVDASEILMDRWPVRHGEKFEAALQTCLDCMEGRAVPDDVRAAFIAAADEAGVHWFE